jgi:hypothetical protein
MAGGTRYPDIEVLQMEDIALTTQQDLEAIERELPLTVPLPLVVNLIRSYRHVMLAVRRVVETAQGMESPSLFPDGPMCLLSDYKAMRDERDAFIVDLKAKYKAAIAEVEIWKGHYNYLGDRFNAISDERNRLESYINAARGGIQPAPLDAPDAPVNPDCTIRGLK